MFDILDSRLVSRVTPPSIGGLDYLLRSMVQDIQGYLDWKHTDVTSVASDHILVSLLITLSQRVGYNPDFSIRDIFQRAHYQIPDMCTVFGFTYSTNPGRLHIGDSGNPTLYILGESPLRAKVDERTAYRKIIPIRYLSHDSTNVSMGSEADAEDLIGLGFDIIEIDPGLLLLQYYGWMKEQLQTDYDAKRPLESFVSMYVIPSLKVSQYSLAFMNRMTAYGQGLPVNDQFYRLSKAFPDRSKMAKDYLGELVNILLHRECKPEYVLEAVPVPMWESVGDANTLPELPPTRQVTWALTCARYNLVMYMVTMLRIDPSRAKQFGFTGIRRSYNRLLNDNSYALGLKGREAKMVKAKFEDLMQITTPL